MKPNIPFHGSFQEIRKVAKCKLSRENNSKAKPLGFSKLVERARVVHRTWHVRAAVRRCAARARRGRPGPRGTRDRRTGEYAIRAKRAPGGCRARSSPDARARAAEPTAEIAEPVKREIFPGREKSDARPWPYRCVERPRGVRSNLGSDLGRFRAPCERRCAKSCATRDEVSGERASRPRLSRECFARAELTQRRRAGVVRSRGRFACAVLDAYWPSGRFRAFHGLNREIET